MDPRIDTYDDVRARPLRIGGTGTDSVTFEPRVRPDEPFTSIAYSDGDGRSFVTALGEKETAQVAHWFGRRLAGDELSRLALGIAIAAGLEAVDDPDMPADDAVEYTADVTAAVAHLLKVLKRDPANYQGKTLAQLRAEIETSQE